MRYSLENGDMGRVTLDGREIRAVACDPDEGYVEAHVDEAGRALGLDERPVLNARGTEVLIGTCRGVVTFEPRE